MLRQFFTLWGIGFGCMIVIMLIVLPLDGVLFYAGLLLAMPVLYVSCSLLTLPQTICIENGSVEVRTPLLTRRFRFSDCEWDVDGRLEDRTWYPFSRFFSTTPAIVLRVRDLGSRNTYFACIDDEARALWRDFLTLAESGCAACAQSGGEKHA